MTNEQKYEDGYQDGYQDCFIGDKPFYVLAGKWKDRTVVRETWTDVPAEHYWYAQGYLNGWRAAASEKTHKMG